MIDARVLETAAGLIFIYLLLSILCSAAFELLASWEWTSRFISSRALMLKEGMTQILGPELQKDLYVHPLICTNLRVAYTGPWAWLKKYVPFIRKEDQSQEGDGRSKLVSYISSGNFSLALAEVLLERMSPSCKDADVSNVLLKLQPASRKAWATIINLRAASGLQLVISNQPPIHAKTEEELVAALDAFFLATPDKTRDIGNLVSGLLRKNMHPDDRPLDAVEKWFEECMDRVSGWYKRASSNWILGLGLVAAVSMNADSIHMARKLWLEKDLRKAVFLQSEAFLKEDSIAPSKLYDPTKADTGSFNRLNRVQKQLAGYSLPIGWNSSSPDKPKGFWGGILRFIGWCITAMAISFGAPFWFDLLNKVVRLRVAGNKPEKKKVEA